MKAEDLREIATHHEEQAATSLQLADIMVPNSPGREVAMNSALRHTAWASQLTELAEMTEMRGGR